MTLRGEDLAYATLDYIREHPEEWSQAAYFCGATACFAGRAILLAGEFPWASMPFQRAQELLGWTETEALSVFCCFTQDFGVLEQSVKAVLSREIS